MRTSLRRNLARVAAPIAALAGIGAFFLLQGCSTTFPNRNPAGEAFSIVAGQSLQKEDIQIPTAFQGEVAVLLVGYLQKTQFDIDRWLIGLIEADVDARIVEIPTLPGLAPTIASRWIDDGMRSGIPTEDWGSVITLYGEAARPVANLTGTEQGNLTRVIVLDREGIIVWFDDKGFSARKALEVARVVDSLPETGG